MKKSVALKLLSLFLCALMLLPVLISCQNPDNPSDTTAAEPTTTVPETEYVPEPVDLVANGTTEYVLVRPDGNDHPLVITAGQKLLSSITEKTGAEIKFDNDWVRNEADIPENAKEIVVGHTNRPQSKKAVEGIREKDFVIAFEGDRVVITGGSDEATDRAVDYFIENYIDGATKKITMRPGFKYVQNYDYFIKSVKINDREMGHYSVVYPEGCDLLTRAAAENLVEYIYKNAGYKIPCVSDKTAETPDEFLVGKTNRSQSNVDVAIGDGQFVLFEKDGKVVMLGNSYMIGGGISELINKYMHTDAAGAELDIKDIPKEPVAQAFEFKEAKNAILLIGDGMGPNHIASTLSSGLKEFVAEKLPNKGFAITDSLSGLTDSAASGTALATGYKTINKYLGVDKYNKPIKNLRELALETCGARTAILSTDLITGATPSAFMVHHNLRSATAIIQGQIDELIAADKITCTGGALDNKFYDEAKAALSKISSENSRYFAMFEEGYIDKHAHNNNMAGVIATVTRFNEVIAYAIEFTICNPDTVLVITADHETGGIVKNADGSFKFTATDHTRTHVPVFAIGSGTEMFNNATVDNTEISKFLAKAYSTAAFGQ